MASPERTRNRQALVSLALLLLLPLLLGFSGCASRAANALSPEYAGAFERELQAIILLHPPYVWGGSEGEAKGLDCSGYLFLAAHRAGLPVQRTTALQMSRGAGGWISVPVTHGDLERFDLVFWTFSASRPNGHVGAVWSACRVTHSTPVAGVTVQKWTERLRKHLTEVRRLTLGD